MPQLSIPAQRRVVRDWAWWMTGKEIQADIEERFGVRPTPTQLTHYNPETNTGSRLRADLKALFAEERRKALKNEDQHPVALAHIRLRKMWDRMCRLDAQGNDLGAQAIARDIERTVGGMFKNRRVLDLNVSPRDALAQLLGVDPADIPAAGVDVPGAGEAPGHADA